MLKEKKFKSLFKYYGFTKTDEKKYPVISRILKKLTPERIANINKEVLNFVIPDFFHEWVTRYNKIGEKNRNEYFWKWLFRTVQTITLSSVLQKAGSSIFEVKLMVIFLVTLFDDVSDKHGVRNQQLLEDLLAALFYKDFLILENYSEKDKKHIILTIDVWENIKKRLKKYPRYYYFESVFVYDVFQFLNSMRYSFLVNSKPAFINPTEYWAYLPHNMQAIISSDIDLMILEGFDNKSLGMFREIAWESQKMARIGNWVSTWEREIYEKDYTSGVFAYALNKKIITLNDFKKSNKRNVIGKIKEARIEKTILKEWEGSYNKIAEKSKEIDESIGIKDLLTSLEKLITYHLSSRRYK